MTITQALLEKLVSDQSLSLETGLESKSSLEEEWKLLGVCRTVDPELWFPEDSSNCRVAKRTCRECPVISECLEYAILNNEKYGVWGGLTPTERKLFRRDVRAERRNLLKAI